MSKMGQTIVDIQEQYYHGNSTEDITKNTKTSKSFVEGVIKDLDEPWVEEWPYGQAIWPDFVDGDII